MFRRSGKKALDVARRLADALLVFDQRDTDVALAVFAEADARRHGDIGLLDQQLGEFELTQLPELLGIGAQANIEAGGGGTSQPARPKLSTSTSRRRL